MLISSNEFKTNIIRDDRLCTSLISTDSTILRDVDYLVSWKITHNGFDKNNIGNFSSKIIEFEFINDGTVENLINQVVNVQAGLIIDDETELLNLGSFLVTEDVLDEPNKIRKIKGTDRAIVFDKTYEKPLEFPCTVLEYVTAICDSVGVEFSGSSFNLSSEILTEEPYVDKTFRSAIKTVAEMAIGNAFIEDDKLVISSLPNVQSSFDFEFTDYFSLFVEKETGSYNSLVLGRTPQEDNLYYPTELPNPNIPFRIDNNQIIDKSREEYLPKIYPLINGINIKPFKMELLKGRVDLSIYDTVSFQDLKDDYWWSYVTEYVLEFKTAQFSQTISCEIKQENETNYNRAGTIREQLRNTELFVDKQNQEIKAIIENQDEQSDQLTQLTQTVDGFQYLVKKSGGSNIMTNSVGFKGITDRWSIRSGSPEHIKTEANNTWILGNSISKHGFVFSGDVELWYDLTDLLVIGREYSFVFTLNKPLGTNFVYSIDEDGTHAHGSPYSLSPTESYDGKLTINFVANGEEHVISFYSSDSAVITDIGIYEGSNAMGWQQASGEMHTLDVQIDKEGIKIYSDESRTAWTIMSPTEFAKYYGNESVFSLNEDITNVMGLQVNGKGLYTPPVKFVQNLNANPISLDIVWTGKGGN